MREESSSFLLRARAIKISFRQKSMLSPPPLSFVYPNTPAALFTKLVPPYALSHRAWHHPYTVPTVLIKGFPTMAREISPSSTSSSSTTLGRADDVEAASPPEEVDPPPRLPSVPSSVQPPPPPLSLDLFLPDPSSSFIPSVLAADTGQSDRFPFPPLPGPSSTLLVQFEARTGGTCRAAAFETNPFVEIPAPRSTLRRFSALPRSSSPPDPEPEPEPDAAACAFAAARLSRDLLPFGEPSSLPPEPVPVPPAARVLGCGVVGGRGTGEWLLFFFAFGWGVVGGRGPFPEEKVPAATAETP